MPHLRTQFCSSREERLAHAISSTVTRKKNDSRSANNEEKDAFKWIGEAELLLKVINYIRCGKTNQQAYIIIFSFEITCSKRIH